MRHLKVLQEDFKYLYHIGTLLVDQDQDQIGVMQAQPKKLREEATEEERN